VSAIDTYRNLSTEWEHFVRKNKAKHEWAKVERLNGPVDVSVTFCTGMPQVVRLAVLARFQAEIVRITEEEAAKLVADRLSDARNEAASFLARTAPPEPDPPVDGQEASLQLADACATLARDDD
jgi:hypothetical protein